MISGGGTTGCSIDGQIIIVVGKVMSRECPYHITVEARLIISGGDG